jgi:fructuronate reductase
VSAAGSAVGPSIAERRERRPAETTAHLGLGAFFRAHQAAYTAADPDAGIVAFTGRRPDAAEALRAQDGVYALVERGHEDSVSLVESVVRAESGVDGDTWRATLGDPGIQAITLTVTEAGCRPDPDDAARLASGGDAVGAIGRLVDGLRARAGVDAPIAIVPCDNLAGNGAVVREGVLAVASAVDERLAAWIDARVSFVSTVVDRITPATTPADLDEVERALGVRDELAVVTEPSRSWILAGDFPAGRPAWERAGARFVDDIEPWERRKLWLLNGAHSLLAYAGLLAGRTTVADAVADERLLAAAESLWREAGDVLPFDADDLAGAADELLARFRNGRIEHRLVQIAADGSAKLGVRIAAPLSARLDAGLEAGEAQLVAIASWAVALERDDVRDPLDADARRAITGAATAADRASRALAALSPSLADHADVVRGVAAALSR